MKSIESDFHFKIWLDEADKFPGHIDVTFMPLIKDHPNIEIYCITATPKKLFDKYKLMNVFQLKIQQHLIITVGKTMTTVVLI